MNNTNKELSPLEIIRQKTKLTQEEFAVYCDIPLATYRRMINKQPSQFKLTPQQIVNICRVSNMRLNEFFEDLGLDLSELPKSN